MRTSHRGIVAIEGREGIRLRVYRDSKGLPTVGVGHLVTKADGLKVGDKITQAQCDAFLEADLAKAENCINTYVTAPLKQNEFDAICSFIVNVGTGLPGGFRSSQVLKFLNKGQKANAATALMNWVTPKEITGRRRSEQKQFLTPYPKTSAAEPTDGNGQVGPGPVSPDNPTPAIGGDGLSEQPPTPTPPQAENQTIVDVPPVTTEPPEGIVSKIKTWYAALPAFLLSLLGGFWSWLQGAATEIIVAFLVTAGVVAIVFIVTNFLARRADKRQDFEAKEKQKERDFELTKLQLLSAMDPNKQTVRVAPPPVVVPNADDSAGTVSPSA